MFSNRVYALGSDTYIRAFPNPGFGICFGHKRLGVSLRGGIEWFHLHPRRRIWIRRWSFLSRVQRPRSP